MALLYKILYIFTKVKVKSVKFQQTLDFLLSYIELRIDIFYCINIYKIINYVLLRISFWLRKLYINMSNFDDNLSEPLKKTSYQLHKTYILSHIKTGFLIIDQHSAHERILYEKYIRQMAHHQSYSQQLLFPVVLNFSRFRC